MQARGSTLALQVRADITRNPEQGYQCSHKRTNVKIYVQSIHVRCCGPLNAEFQRSCWDAAWFIDIKLPQFLFEQKILKTVFIIFTEDVKIQGNFLDPYWCSAKCFKIFLFDCSSSRIVAPGNSHHWRCLIFLTRRKNNTIQISQNKIS